MISPLRLLKLALSSNSIRRGLFGSVLIGLIVVSILSYMDTVRLAVDGQEVGQTYRVIFKLNSMSAAISDMATDIRSSISQGVSASEAVQTIETQFNTQAQELDDLIPDSSPQQANVGTLRQALAVPFTALETAAVQRIGNSALSFGTALLTQQDQISSASEKIIEAMSTQENTVLLKREAATSMTQQRTSLTVSLVAVGSVLLLSLIFYSLDRETRKHYRTATALRKSEEHAHSIVDALTEGVVLSNVDGTVAVINPSAERMLTPVAKDGLHGVQLYQEDGSVLVEENYPSAIALRTGTPQYDVILRLERSNGEQLWLATNTQPLFHSGENIPYAALMSLSDITERIRFQTDLKDVRDQALGASRAKSAFLANMSHEIRTPMNGVIGMTDLVLETPINDTQREMVEVIRTSAHNLMTIINDILDFSKVEAGKLTLENGEFHLLNLIESAADVVKPKVFEKKLSLMTFVDPATPLSLYGDELRLRQILINLLGNAVKFTMQGEIVVRAALETLTETQATIRFSIRDSGIGLSETARQRLFQPFMQADESMSRRYGGTGLGLAICAQLVELMHGKIGVDSQEGAGSEFWFSVPLKISTVKTLPQGALPSVADLHHLRVLVVDDNEAARMIISTYLSAWNCICESTPDGASALGELRRAVEAGQPYAIAIVDMVMPNMNGLMLANAIKHDVLIAPTQIISLTAFQEGEYDAATHAADFSAFLTKPIKLPKFLLTLSNLSRPIPDRTVSTSVLTSFPAQEPDVLLVEDNAINRKVATMQLQKLGWPVQIAVNGQEALDALAEKSYSLVFMDCQMPGMDGFEATRRIRRLEAGSERHIPIIAMTANAMQGDKEACLLAGMDDYISKPMNLSQLQGVVEKWLSPILALK